MANSEGSGDGQGIEDKGGKSPKKFKFKIENESYDWDDQFIKGSEVRSVGPGIPETMDLYLKVRGAPGRLVANEEEVDLADDGIEKFYSQDASSEAGSD